MSYGWLDLKERRLKSVCENRLRSCTDLNVSGCKFMNHAWGVKVRKLKFLRDNSQHANDEGKAGKKLESQGNQGHVKHERQKNQSVFFASCF